MNQSANSFKAAATAAGKAKLFIAGVVVTLTVVSFYAFRSTDAVTSSYMEISVVESIIPGGLGRSKMLITDASGKSSELKMENLYSLVGINFSNIQANDNAVVNKINALAKEGWSLVNVISGVQSPNKDEGGIFLTRYFFRKQH
jgi:hypothetical protein